MIMCQWWLVGLSDRTGKAVFCSVIDKPTERDVEFPRELMRILAASPQEACVRAEIHYDKLKSGHLSVASKRRRRKLYRLRVKKRLLSQIWAKLLVMNRHQLVGWVSEGRALVDLRIARLEKS